MNKSITIIILAILSCILFSCSRNPLEEYGVSYLKDVGPTGTFYTYEVFRDYKGKRIRGPMVAGSMLKLHYNDIDSDGVSEIIISSKVHKSYKTIIKVHPKLIDGKKHFSVVSSEGLKVNWPVDGYTYH